jgi:hypothetical protein
MLSGRRGIEEKKKRCRRRRRNKIRKTRTKNNL